MFSQGMAPWKCDVFQPLCAATPPLCADYGHNSKQPQMTTCVVAARRYASLPKPSTSLTTISSSFRSTPLPLRPFRDPAVAFTLTSEAATWATRHRPNVYTRRSLELFRRAPTLHQRFFWPFSIFPKTVIVPSHRSYKLSFWRGFSTQRFAAWSVAQTKSYVYRC